MSPAAPQRGPLPRGRTRSEAGSLRSRRHRCRRRTPLERARREPGMEPRHLASRPRESNDTRGGLNLPRRWGQATGSSSSAGRRWARGRGSQRAAARRASDVEVVVAQALERARDRICRPPPTGACLDRQGAASPDALAQAQAAPGLSRAWEHLAETVRSRGRATMSGMVGDGLAAGAAATSAPASASHPRTPASKHKQQTMADEDR